MIKKIKTFIRLRPQLKIITFQAFVLSVYTGFIFTFFNRYARFGERIAANETLPPGPLLISPKGEGAQTSETSSIPERNEALHFKINDIARAIQISSKYVPWKNVCRHQAYQAKLLCNYYKIPCLIFIGFKKGKDRNEIQAHAWTIAGRRMITGLCNPEEYMVQSIYRNKWQ